MVKFVYRGKSEDELKALSLEEFRDMAPSRVRRVIKRGFTDDQKKLLARLKKNPKKICRTKLRELIVIPELIGTKLAVHSGKEFVNLDIKAEMLGHRLGEFVPTRKEVKHSSPGFGATKSSKFVPLK